MTEERNTAGARWVLTALHVMVSLSFVQLLIIAKSRRYFYSGPMLSLANSTVMALMCLKISSVKMEALNFLIELSYLSAAVITISIEEQPRSSNLTSL